LIKKYSELCVLCVSVVKTGFGYLTAEALRARSKEFLIKTYSELSELCVSVVKKGLGDCTAEGAETTSAYSASLW
jgi:hypothetical protein